MKKLILIFLFFLLTPLISLELRGGGGSQDDLALITEAGRTSKGRKKKRKAGTDRSKVVTKSVTKSGSGKGSHRRKMLTQLGFNMEVPSIEGCLPQTDPRTSDNGTYYLILAQNHGLYLGLLARLDLQTDDDRRTAFLLRRQIALARINYVNLAIKHETLAEHDQESALQDLLDLVEQERTFYGTQYRKEADRAYKDGLSFIGSVPTEESEEARLERLEQAHNALSTATRKYGCARAMGNAPKDKRLTHLKAKRGDVERELSSSPRHKGALSDRSLAEKAELKAEKSHKELKERLNALPCKKRKKDDPAIAALKAELELAETLASKAAKWYMNAYEKRANEQFLADAERALRVAQQIRTDIHELTGTQSIPAYADGETNLYRRLRRLRGEEIV